MITFSTNIFNKISQSNRSDLEKSLNESFKINPPVSLDEYKDEDLKDNLKTKFVLGDLPLKHMITEIKTWDSFVKLLKKILVFSKISTEENEVHFWVTSKDFFPVIIVFSIRDEKEIEEKLQSLRDTLVISNVFQENNLQKDKTLVVGYDIEGNTWRISYI